jgi:transposase-like protein
VPLLTAALVVYTFFISRENKMKQLERENRELKRANEILRKASAFFAQAELHRPVNVL